MTAINRHAFQPLPQENYFNPIRQHFKKGNKTNPNPLNPHTPTHTAPTEPHTLKQLAFRDLSKDRPEYYTQLQKQPSESSFKGLKQECDLNGIRKRLFENDSASSSRDKSMSFSDIIRQSREKKLREESRPRVSLLRKESGSGAKKEGKAFNALKARLMGENNPNAANIIQSKPAKPHHTPIVSKPHQPYS